jgi:hypothetical protein
MPELPNYVTGPKSGVHFRYWFGVFNSAKSIGFKAACAFHDHRMSGRLGEIVPRQKLMCNSHQVFADADKNWAPVPEAFSYFLIMPAF